MVCLYQQIGCFMGFSITGCVYSGTMFICYSITLAVYAEMKKYCDSYKTYSPYRYKSNRYDTNKNYDCYGRYGLRATAENLAGLGSCLLILSLVELVVAIASSIYCCKTVCCNSGRVGNTVSNYHQQFSC